MFRRTLFIFILTCVIFLGLIQAEVTKVAFIGNSITIGSGLSNPKEQCYPSQFGVFVGDEYEIGNFAVSGRTMLKKGDFPIWNEPQFPQALEFKPDILFIMLGTNDSKPQNWDDFGNEYKDDYIAMIDTFMQAENPPEVWACLPPPAYAVQWGIRDSVIKDEMIPIIEEIIVEKGLGRVDYYTPLIGQGHLFPDDIHPDAAGAEVMARILYETFTGKTITSSTDINVAREKNVVVSSDIANTAPDLTDGNPLTSWSFEQLPATAVVDLGAPQAVDAALLQLLASNEAGLQFTIEGSTDNENWTMLSDQSGRTADDALAVSNNWDAVEFQYIRLTVTGAENAQAVYHVSELKVYAAMEHHHAPGMNPVFDRASSKYIRYEVFLTPVSNVGEKFKIFKDMNDGTGGVAVTGFKSGADASYKVLIRPEQQVSLFSVCYFDGVEVVSDTLTFEYSKTDIGYEGNSSFPESAVLYPGYPNPFNPESRIRFELLKNTEVKLSVFDVNGRLIRTLANGFFSAGQHEMVWQGNSNSGEAVVSGTYIVRLNTENTQEVQRIILMK